MLLLLTHSPCTVLHGCSMVDFPGCEVSRGTDASVPGRGRGIEGSLDTPNICDGMRDTSQHLRPLAGVMLGTRDEVQV